MSSEYAIKVENLGKCYQIYDKPRDRLLQMLLRRHKQLYREFWALRDVSFEVGMGETVGIVGCNGSGKSTLLQLICGTLNPTGGTIQSIGRVAALLELGSGFNPEFTGRENVFMNAAVLGLTRDEISFRFDDIAAFADIGEFIEQPVKTYSSGMVVRLAFAVAISVEPQILVVDEALSVGDELFQRKCYSRIAAIKKNGATILLVSHSGATVVELCDRAILLDGGQLLTSGTPKSVVGKYQKLLFAPAAVRAAVREEIRGGATEFASVAAGSHSHAWQDGHDQAQEPQEAFAPELKPQSTIVYESHGATIGVPWLSDSAGNPVNCLVRGRHYRYIYTVCFAAPACNVRFGMLIKTVSGFELGGAASAAAGIKDSIDFVAADSEWRVEFRFRCSLTGGTYFLNAGVLGLREGQEIYLHRVIDACMFRVLPDRETLATGVMDFNCVPRVEATSGACRVTDQ